MPLSLADLQTPQTKEQVQATLTDFLVTLGFPVTSWQEEGAARGFLEGVSALGASFTERVASLAKFVDLETATGDFLDVKARSDFEETRLPAVATVISATFINAGSTTHGPLAAGAIIARSANGSLFSSVGVETITASANTIVGMQAQTAGSAANIGAETLQLVTPLAGVTATTDGTLVTAGAAEEDDTRLRNRCRVKWGTLRIQQAAIGVESLALEAAPGLTDVLVRATNPRGPGTVDVYLSAANATAGTSDVAAVQAALDLSFLGNGSSDQLVQAVAANTFTMNVTATVYVSVSDTTEVTTAINSALTTFIESIPIGGFDLSPGPTNTIASGQILKALSSPTDVVSVDLTAPSADLAIDPTTKTLAGTLSITVVTVA